MSAAATHEGTGVLPGCAANGGWLASSWQEYRMGWLRSVVEDECSADSPTSTKPLPGCRAGHHAGQNFRA
jgi:hypothetical protein